VIANLNAVAEVDNPSRRKLEAFDGPARPQCLLAQCPDVLMWHTPGALRKVDPVKVSVEGLISHFWRV